MKQKLGVQKRLPNEPGTLAQKTQDTKPSDKRLLLNLSVPILVDLDSGACEVQALTCHRGNDVKGLSAFDDAGNNNIIIDDVANAATILDNRINPRGAASLVKTNGNTQKDNLSTTGEECEAAPATTESKKCRACGEQVFWTSKCGSPILVDLDGTNHMDTCPSVDRLRARKK